MTVMARRQRLAALRLRQTEIATRRARVDLLRLQAIRARLDRLSGEVPEAASLDRGWKLMALSAARARLATAEADITARIAAQAAAVQAAETAEARAQKLVDMLDAAQRATAARQQARRAEDWHGNCFGRDERQETADADDHDIA